MSNKEERELRYAETFARYVNSQYGYDYVVHAGTREYGNYPDIDAILISSNKGLRNLFLQNTGDEIPESSEDQPGKPLVLFHDPESGEDTILFSGAEIDAAVKRKTDKYKIQNKDISNVILLIESVLPRSEAEGLVNPLRQKYVVSGWQGIYFISSRATFYSGGSSQFSPEYVLPIKEAF